MNGTGRVGSRAGFSLIEVCLAVLVVGLGLLSVFSLFPTGVRFSEDSVADTRMALFAGNVLSKMRARADSITSWSVWNDKATFAQQVTQDVPAAGSPSTVAFPDGSSTEYVRYTLTVDTSDPNRYSACLKVCDGQYGGFNYPGVFYTEFTFKGQ